MRQYFDRIVRKTDTPEEEYRSLFRALVCELLGRSSSDVLLAEEVRLSESEILIMLEAIKEVRSGRPIQYIIGHTEFYGLRIACDERVLIPRPETEELIRWIDDEHNESLSILDIGTGSGCIAFALASLGQRHEISALEKSPQALELARINAANLDLKVNFIRDDILDLKEDLSNYDLIVSNPPYVRQSEKASMKSRVLDHEPHLALFVKDENPLLFYNSIAKIARTKLITGGSLYFEINEGLAPETMQLLIELGFENIQKRADLYGKDRMIRALWNG